MTPLSVLGLINIIVTYTQVWYIIGIVSSSPTDCHSEKIGLIRVQITSPVSMRVKSALEVTYTQVWYIIGIVSSSPTDFHSEKIGLIRVTYDPLSVLGLINIIMTYTYTQVWYIIGIASSSPTDFHSEKIGLIRDTKYLPCQY